MTARDQGETANSLRWLEPHYALSEEARFRLHQLSRAMSGLASLTAPDEIELAEQPVDTAREDLAAIFDVMRMQLDGVIGALPFVSAAAIASAQEIGVVVASKGMK